MKLYLTIGQKPLNGYLTIDPASDSISKDRQIGDIRNLDTWAVDASCYEIFADGVLDYIPIRQVNSVLQHYATKLRHGGKLSVIGTDLHTACLLVVNKNLDVVEANDLLHGQQQDPWQFKQGQINLNELTELLQHIGLEITSSNLDIQTAKMVVNARRP